MERKVRELISVVVFMLLLVFVLLKVSDLLERKNSRNKYAMFYENVDKVDVLFFGPSVPLYGICPAELWDDFGIAAYNNANESERLATTYWVIKNSLDYCRPGLVVVDMTALAWGAEKTDGTLKDHNFLDSLPLSANKVRMVMDLFPEKERAEYIWNFILYHSRWPELGKDDDEINCRMGGETRIGIKYNSNPRIGDPKESRNDLSDEKIIYLDKIAELCKEENINLLFTFLPYSAHQGDIVLREFVKKYCQDNQIDYLDMLDKNIVNYKMDYMDEIHLNPAGAKKVTRYIGKYIVDHYDIENRHRDVKYAVWNDNLQKYMEYKKQLLAEEKNIYNYISLLEDGDYGIVYQVKKDSQLYEDEKIVFLLDDVKRENMYDVTAKMVNQYLSDMENEEQKEKRDLYLEVLQSGCIPEDVGSDILFFVIDKKKGKIVDIASFTFASTYQNKRQ